MMKPVGAKLLIGLTGILLGACSTVISPLPAPPSLDLDFTHASLPAGLTFTRTTSATRIDQKGLLQLVGQDEPRFEYDPVTRAIRGLLIEEQRTNLFHYSEQIEQPFYGKEYSRVFPNVALAPDGTPTAERLQEAASEHTVHRLGIGYPKQSNAAYTCSLFVKADQRSQFSINFDVNFAANQRATYDLRTGTYTTTGRIVAGIQPISGGWYRVWASVVSNNSPTKGYAYLEMQKEANLFYTGDGRSGLFLWGAQLEEGPFVTSYISTKAAPVTRAEDVCTVDHLPTWFNHAEGSWVAETLLGQPLTASIVGYDNHSVFLGISSFSQAVSEARTDQTTVRTAVGTGGSGIVRHAMAYNDTCRVVTRENLPPVTSLTKIGPVTQIRLGADQNGQHALNAHLRRIIYYPYMHPNASLQALTR